MNLALVLIIGAAIGALEAASIFFEPAEPYKVEILLAATLKNMLVSLTTGLSLTTLSTLSHWWLGVGYGALYGLAFGLVVFLAKGAFKSKDAPYVVPSGVIIGAATGLLLVKFALHSQLKVPSSGRNESLSPRRHRVDGIGDRKF